MLTFSPTHVELNSGVTDVSPGPNRITVGKSSVPGGGFDRGAFSSFFFRDRRENRDFRHRFFCEIFHIYMYSFIGSSVESIFFFFFFLFDAADSNRSRRGVHSNPTSFLDSPVVTLSGIRGPPDTAPSQCIVFLGAQYWNFLGE